jgi:hypothetical protein
MLFKDTTVVGIAQSEYRRPTGWKADESGSALEGGGGGRFFVSTPRPERYRRVPSVLSKGHKSFISFPFSVSHLYLLPSFFKNN